MPRSSLYAMQQAMGATFADVAGWELPKDFGDPEAEYRAVRQGVGLSDLSYRGCVRVTGNDRQRFLHAMVSNDTARLQPGQGCYATFLTHKGRLVADFMVYAEPDAYVIDLEPHLVQALIDGLDRFVISEDVLFLDESTQWGLLALQGPGAAEVLARTLPQDLPALNTYAHLRCQLAGHEVRLIRRSQTGEQGYQLMAPLAALPDLWQALWQHVETCEGRAVGLDALEVLRIEAGIPLHGRDMTDDTIPVEANLDDAISYTKGCYIGQEVIARIEGRGHVNRKLVGLLLNGERRPEAGSKLVSLDRDVGWITSITYSPACQQNIALGYVRREVWTPGTQLAVQATGMTVQATVAALPFYEPRSAN